jgi:hypothetical protein
MRSIASLIGTAARVRSAAYWLISLVSLRRPSVFFGGDVGVVIEFVGYVQWHSDSLERREGLRCSVKGIAFRENQ